MDRPIFFYSFNAIVFFVLLNILLAILVEAYMKVLKTKMLSLVPFDFLHVSFFHG